MRGSSGSAQAGRAGGATPAPVEGRSVALDLAVGQKLSATVLELLGGREVLVGMRGLRVKARSEVPLEPGRTYTFTVKEAGDRIRLSPLLGEAGAQARIAAGLARLLSRGGASLLGPRLAELAQSLDGTGDREGGTPLARLLTSLNRWPDSAGRLRHYLQNLGVDTEARLLRAARNGRPPAAELATNLKSLLLVARGKGEKGPAAARALEALEALQGENLHRQRAAGGQVYPLPLVPGLRSGELYLFPPPPREEEGGNRDRDEEGGPPFRVVFMLDLVRLGSLRVDLEVRREQLHLLFRSPDPHTVELMKEHRGALWEAFVAAGLNPLAVEVKRSRDGGRDDLPPLDRPPSRLEEGGLVDVEG